MPDWHLEMAHAFAARTAGSDGTLATLAGANGLWGSLRRFLRFLDSLPRPPRTIVELRPPHLERFRLHRSRSMQQRGVVGEVRAVLRLLERMPGRSRLRPEVAALFTRAQLVDRRMVRPVGGYDDTVREAILKCARADAVRIARRLKAGEDLLERFRTAPELLSGPEAERGADLAAMDATGRIPSPRGVPVTQVPISRIRWDLAGQLFLTLEDLAPLVVLGVMASGWNGETIKELPARHRVLEGGAVVLEAVKRRRGSLRWFEEVTVDIGRDSERFTTAGGYYLFIERLTRRGRRFSRSDRVWSVWVGGRKNGKDATFGHVDPFARLLGRQIGIRAWGRAQPELAALDGFVLDLNRLKTTEDRRYTRATGGHLPSAARTNTQDVLFSNYLRGDQVVQEWAADVIGDSLADAEAAAWAEHRKAVEANGSVTVLAPGDGQDASGRRSEAAFTACRDHTDSPFNPGPCRASFLRCFACRNALATQDHLPAQLALLDELAAAWETMDRDRWWQRFGQPWLAITEDILPRFTPAEQEAAARIKPAHTVLDLLEGPQEEPWV
ncbi:hypothetical protein AB0G42_19500 [Streptomyces yangpuensis]|uniref:hypothetical protein n=1 Tax=Streptomyces yangpuensis TaxID=1648182 RepID=UPI003417DAF9